MALENLIRKNAIYKVHRQPCFLSTIFLVPKSSGKHRFILNPTGLNAYISVPRLHMPNHLRGLVLNTFRISTLLNNKADDLSGQPFSTLEWSLPQSVFNDLVRLRGRLVIDLMATSLNTKPPRHLSPFPDPQAVGCNALTWDWYRWSQIYVFPPQWLIPTVISKASTLSSPRLDNSSGLPGGALIPLRTKRVPH